MGTATQLFRIGSSGALLVPLNGGTTATPFAPVQFATVQTTGGSYTIPASPVVCTDEEEWAALLAVERQSAKKRIKPGSIDKAISELRYGK